MYAFEGCSSIADKDGKLLFYTNGTTVWNGNHDIMKNGDSLYGGISSTQSSLIIRKPLSKQYYYVFTTDHISASNRGINFSCVDIYGDSGRGEIILKNNFLLGPTSEKLNATMHFNNKDIWICGLNGAGDSIYIFKLTEAGIYLTNKIQVTNPPNFDTRSGQMKFSPDGRFLAYTLSPKFRDPLNGFAECVYLFDFDNLTGLVSNKRQIIDFSSFAGDEFYGLEFSPNSKYLYVTKAGSGLFQVDVSKVKENSYLDSTGIKISTFKPLGSYGSLQLGPDNRIYVAIWNVRSVPFVKYPDSAGLKCEYTGLIDLYNKRAVLGLPNILLPNLYVHQICLSDTTQIRLRATAVDSVRWDFGDGHTGFTLTAEVKHFYADTGTYPMVAYVYRPGRTDTFYYPLRIYTIQPPVLGADRLICAADSLQYDVSHHTIERYTWSHGSLNSSVTIKQPGRYKVKVENYGCVAEDSVEIKTVTCGFSAKGFCPGDTTIFKLDTADNDSVEWDFGNGKKVLTTSDSVSHKYSPGSYTVTATLYKDGLSVNSLKNITITTVRQPSLGNDTLLCENDSLVMDVSDTSYSAYQWNDGALVAGKVIKVPGTYWVRVETGGCSQADTVRVEKTGCVVSASGFCLGDTTVFNFNHTADSVQWDFGNGNLQTQTVHQMFNTYSNGGNYTVVATVYKNGLKRDVALPVSITALPMFDLGPDTVVCADDVIDPKINAPGISYLWNDGTTNPIVTVLKSGTYILQVQKSGCFARDSVTLAVEDCECEVYIPTAFTPTNNNLNEMYAPVAFCELTQYRLDIFNKWGELIFTSDNINTPWQGTYKGQACPAGVYIYVITYRDKRTLKQFTEKGTVTLIR